MGKSRAEGIVVESRGAVRVIRLVGTGRRARANAEMHSALARVWSDLAQDQDAKAVVLTGSGTDFCGGGDLDWMAGVQPNAGRVRETFSEVRKILFEMLDCPLPIVAAVRGAAVGLGASLAVSADILYFGEEAYLQDSHVATGLVAGDGGAMLWPSLVGHQRAKEWLLTGQPVPAALAYESGIGNGVFPEAEVEQRALDTAAVLADLPWFAVQATKRSINMQLSQGLRSSGEYALMAEFAAFQGATFSSWLRSSMEARVAKP